MTTTVLQGAVYRILLRVHRGEKVQPYRGSFSAMTLADKLVADRLVEIARTPGGRKAWYELTKIGEGLIPAALAWEADQKAHHKLLEIAREREDRYELALPKCYRYVQALADAGDQDAKRFLVSMGVDQ